MWPAKRPIASASEAAQACARGTRDLDLRSRLLAAQKLLEDNSVRLQNAAKEHKLHQVSAITYAVNGLTDKEMKDTYKGQLGRVGRPASSIRDQLVGSAPHGLCCYCQYGPATTLDHFVPKDRVPTLSIDPWNLVPACARCNHKLQANFGYAATDQMLHPYAMPPVGRWLWATANRGDPVSISFQARPQSSLSTEIGKRITNEFLSLDLNLLYSVASGRDIAEINATLTRLFEPGDEQTVQAHLREAALDAFSTDDNSRRGAIFEALSNEAWYCVGGYLPRTVVNVT